MVENGPQILYHLQGRVFMFEMVSRNLGSIRKFPGNFLMEIFFSQIWTICELPILNSSSQGGTHQEIPWEFSNASMGCLTLDPLDNSPGIF